MIKILLVLFVPIFFLLISFFTLRDYGINWDEPKHLIRGQSYLHFILTGRHDFLDLPVYPQPKGAPDYVDFNVEGVTNSGIIKERSSESPNYRRSYFQSDFYTFDYFLVKHIHTHPEVNNLLLATSNYVLYQKLGLIGDLESYHLLIVLVTFLLVLVLAFWVYRRFGIFASIVSTTTLSIYPLVFSEAHFNVKDPILMSFWGLCVLTFWAGFTRNKAGFILLSYVFAGIALGTKFNAVFLVPVLGLWILFNLVVKYRKEKIKKFWQENIINRKGVLISILIGPLIALGILYLLSPYLWSNPIEKFLGIVDYYKTIGTDAPEQSKFLYFGWNMYPLVWIILTTPIPVLFLSIIGFSYSLFLVFKKRDDTAFLILLWFIIPIGRVVWPGMNIYGGVRQIMEFIPAMAVLTGIGALFLVKLTKTTFPKLGWLPILTKLLIIISLIFVIFEMMLIHPYQNVYFNQLIGGLSGASKREIPSWGNTYGSVYLSGIKWLNENAEIDSRVALPINYISAVPRLKLRRDIDLDNNHFSGPNRGGEYGMELSYDWPLKSRYKYAYYETFLDPVYEVKVDGVPLLKIWKNDLNHTKSGFETEVEIKPKSVSIEKIKSQTKLKLDFETRVYLTRLIIDYSITNCQKQDLVGFVETSLDDESWTRERDPLIDPEYPNDWMGRDEDTYVFMFPARIAQSIVLNTEMVNSCILNNPKIKVMGLLK